MVLRCNSTSQSYRRTDGELVESEITQRAVRIMQRIIGCSRSVCKQALREKLFKYLEARDVISLGKESPSCTP